MKTTRELSESFLLEYPAEAARLLEQLPSSEVGALLREASVPATGPVLQRMPPLPASAALADAGPEGAGPLLEELPLDVAARLLRCLPPDTREPLRAAVGTRTGRLLETLLHYQEGTAGALMDPRTVAVAEDMTASEALSSARANPESLRYYLYVVSRDGNRLTGVVSLRELMLADERTHIHSMMQRNVESLSVYDGPASILAHPGWLRLPVLPVVDDTRALAGIVRYETLRRLEREGTTLRTGDPTLATVLDLGELCWIGLAGMLAGFASSVTGEERTSS